MSSPLIASFLTCRRTIRQPSFVVSKAPTQFPLPGSPQRIRSPLTPLQKAAKQRRKVALEPGHSALDWARLKSSGVDLTDGARGMKKITMEEVQRHRTKADAWTVLGGKVYNITPYLKFHPGGMLNEKYTGDEDLLE